MGGWLRRFRWLYAPRAVDFGFALRTTIAALLALVLALWMEMDDPQWAAMTTWIVAQNSRGQSMSKARWRLLGTVCGAVAGVALIAALPQSSCCFSRCWRSGWEYVAGLRPSCAISIPMRWYSWRSPAA